MSKLNHLNVNNSKQKNKPEIMRKIVLTVLFTIIFLSCNTKQYEIETELKKQLNIIIDEVGIPGINLSVLMPDNNIIAVSAGYSDKEKQILMKPEDKMFSGSTGKTFCAAIILQLIDEGKLDVDDSIFKHFGEEEWFNKLPNANDVTIRMLLNHTHC